MFDLLSPRQVGDMNQALYAFFNLHESAKVGKVTYGSCVGTAHRIFDFNTIPWIRLELLHTERHLALVAVECEDHCLHLFTYGHEVLCAVKMLRPAHFRYVNQPFHTGGDFYECTVIGNDHYFSLHDVTHLQSFTECIPWMRSQLLQTECNALFLVVEIKDYHVDLVVELYHLFGMLNASP